MQFKSQEEAQNAIMEFSRLVLEAQGQCGIDTEIIVVINVGGDGTVETTMYGSGDMRKWLPMLKEALRMTKKIDHTLESDSFKKLETLAVMSDEEVTQFKAALQEHLKPEIDIDL